MGAFGLKPGLRAVRASLLGVRRANRDVQGGVRVANGGEDVGGPEISAKDDARNLGLGGVITGMGSSMDECGNRIVASARAQQVA